jgi:hypothetical protein
MEFSSDAEDGVAIQRQILRSILLGWTVPSSKLKVQSSKEAPVGKFQSRELDEDCSLALGTSFEL